MMNNGEYGYGCDHLMEEYSPSDVNGGTVDVECADPTKNLTRGKIYCGYFTMGGQVCIDDDKGTNRTFSSERFRKPMVVNKDKIIENLQYALHCADNVVDKVKRLYRDDVTTGETAFDRRIKESRELTKELLKDSRWKIK